MLSFQSSNVLLLLLHYRVSGQTHAHVWVYINTERHNEWELQHLFDYMKTPCTPALLCLFSVQLFFLYVYYQYSWSFYCIYQSYSVLCSCSCMYVYISKFFLCFEFVRLSRLIILTPVGEKNSENHALSSSCKYIKNSVSTKGVFRAHFNPLSHQCH